MLYAYVANVMNTVINISFLFANEILLFFFSLNADLGTDGQSAEVRTTEG